LGRGAAFTPLQLAPCESRGWLAELRRLAAALAKEIEELNGEAANPIG
jgi:hypothetical protein